MAPALVPETQGLATAPAQVTVAKTSPAVRVASLVLISGPLYTSRSFFYELLLRLTNAAFGPLSGGEGVRIAADPMVEKQPRIRCGQR